MVMLVEGFELIIELIGIKDEMPLPLGVLLTGIEEVPPGADIGLGPVLVSAPVDDSG